MYIDESSLRAILLVYSQQLSIVSEPDELDTDSRIDPQLLQFVGPPITGQIIPASPQASPAGLPSGPQDRLHDRDRVNVARRMVLDALEQQGL